MQRTVKPGGGKGAQGSSQSYVQGYRPATRSTTGGWTPRNVRSKTIPSKNHACLNVMYNTYVAAKLSGPSCTWGDKTLPLIPSSF